MVAYNVFNIDPNELAPGTYAIEESAPLRGVNKGTAVRRVFQVKKKIDNSGNEVNYWSLIPDKSQSEEEEDGDDAQPASRPTQLGGRPPQMTARALNLRDPNAAEKKAYDNGQIVIAEAAFDLQEQNPTSTFTLKKRKDGNSHVYYWAADMSNRKKKEGNGFAKPRKAKVAKKSEEEKKRNRSAGAKKAAATRAANRVAQ